MAEPLTPEAEAALRKRDAVAYRKWKRIGSAEADRHVLLAIFDAVRAEPLTPEAALRERDREWTKRLKPLLDEVHTLRAHDYPGQLTQMDEMVAEARADADALRASLDATLVELSESPLPGARYAYDVVRRRFGITDETG
jgi:hypothetical protein